MGSARRGLCVKDALDSFSKVSSEQVEQLTRSDFVSPTSSSFQISKYVTKKHVIFTSLYVSSRLKIGRRDIYLACLHHSIPAEKNKSDLQILLRRFINGTLFHPFKEDIEQKQKSGSYVHHSVSDSKFSSSPFQPKGKKNKKKG